MTLPDGTHTTLNGFGYGISAGGTGNGGGGPPFPQTTSTISSSSLPSHQHVDYPSSYLQLSDLRTGSKRKRASTASTCSLSTPPSIHSEQEAVTAAVAAAQLQVAPSGLERCFFESAVLRAPQDLCVDCVVDCTDADCQAAVSSAEKCTDQCIVVPCNEPETCHNVCMGEPCRLENCNGGDQCFGVLDDSFQLLCCTDYHDCTKIDWNCAVDEILGINGCNYNFNSPGYTQFPPSSSQVSSVVAPTSVSTFPNVQNNSANANFTAIPQEPSAPTGSSGNTVASTPAETQMQVAMSAPQPISNQIQGAATSTHKNDFVCLWHGCSLSFNSLNELVGHVNLTHLRPPSPSSLHPSKRLRLDHDPDAGNPPAPPAQVGEGLDLSCHWADCNLYPNASTIPGPSTGLQPELAFDLLSNHFLHDHLGLSAPPSQLSQLQVPSVFENSDGTSNANMVVENAKVDNTLMPDTNPVNGQVLPIDTSVSSLRQKPDTSNSSSKTTENQVSEPPKLSYATPAPSPPPSSSSPTGSNNPLSGPEQQPHDCSTSTHTCLWSSCNLTFPTCAALTEHLAQAHVGSGKGHYECHWGACTRHGKQGFSSKQKIMRHLQAHTGHRPFACKTCGQHFSEAATLAQHMRRHTQEKPFVCDFPGCGKAFAITGALTIHKRTHNGEKPFRCPHCERAFAESSNLSKHLRTHTGDRPYRCPEPGCGKAFARPDQLQRHGNVHAKKRVSPSGSANGTSDNAINVAGMVEKAESASASTGDSMIVEVAAN